ncbi:MAG: molybdopterin-dependent oxidoreductase [Candidatus Latescibacteria bacterium]|nr:molybdopterin-dependent oxidoreductase [Candidatus Latescibacterota bacterium]NIM21728.1 molybdopterin-dependent oxidoreductase [Candidatus Latescibacterota bacterium]NIM65866.1 molybdopterin-dependent oxidoreductase [Candidatus Latescibacterota bacterium]NIO02611.1 molybdopterin-dependent oxidoreductase [Candidatus Latescibacterota bacterium]NIO29592.1 molybdopterin-dependent oxidoreductase [Candidatus Latescibacterota bacterium]
MKDFRHIGKDIPRPEAPDKAAGKAVYIHDLVRPGMLFGKIKFSDHAHARILRIDTSKAEKLPGVKAVITAYNTPELRIGFVRDNFALKKDKVRQFRDEVAAVAAIDPHTAAEAVGLIKVEYEPIPGVFSPEEAMEPGAPLVHETDPRGRPMKDNRHPLHYHHESGDVKAGEKAAKFVAQGEFSTQLVQQCCMGTAGCIAEFDMNNNLTMWAKTQIPFLAQRDFNQALSAMGLQNKNTRVIVPTLGGGFGTGLDTHAYEYIAILLAFRTGKPVKIVYTRDEEFANLSPRQSSRTKIIQGCDKNGKLTFRHAEVLQDNGAYTSWGATYPTVMMMPATSLYRVSNVYFDAKLVYTNNTYCQAMRGYGNPEFTWALENNMDQLAEKAEIDPFEFRMINCNQPGETTPMGLKVSTCGLKECMESVAGKLNWKKSRSQKKQRGIGMASLIHVGGGGRIYRSDGSGLILKLDDFGNVNTYCGGVEMGQGLHAVLILEIAEALGVQPEKVFINPTDTGTCPWDVGTHASRGAFMAGNTAIMAAKKLRDQIFEHAEQLFPELAAKNLKKYQKKHPDYAPPDFDIKQAAKRDRFDLVDGFVFLKDAPSEPWTRIELGALLRAIHFREQGQMLATEVFYDPPNELPDFEKGYGNMSATYAYGAQGVEVEVDTETGEVKILRMVAAHDVGRVLNPPALKGQIYGGLAQGVGYALYEQLQSERGRITNPNFRDYKIPTAHEMDFPIELDLIETNDQFGPFGAKGIAEPGLVPTAPAIANAIYNAVGVRIRDLPITPEKILAALEKLKSTKD